MQYGFKDIYGFTWLDSQVDRYTSLQAKCNQYKVAPEHLLNAKHKLYSENYIQFSLNTIFKEMEQINLIGNY